MATDVPVLPLSAPSLLAYAQDECSAGVASARRLVRIARIIGALALTMTIVLTVRSAVVDSDIRILKPQRILYGEIQFFEPRSTSDVAQVRIPRLQLCLAGFGVLIASAAAFRGRLWRDRTVFIALMTNAAAAVLALTTWTQLYSRWTVILKGL